MKTVAIINLHKVLRLAMSQVNFAAKQFHVLKVSERVV